MESRKKILGFTLVELMITIAVISVLVSIGYPMYQDQVYKSRRAAARGSLLELAQFMERNYTEANRYDKLADGVTDVSLPFLTLPRRRKEVLHITVYRLALTRTPAPMNSVLYQPHPRQRTIVGH